MNIKKILSNSTYQIVFALISGLIFGAILKLFSEFSYVDFILTNGILKLLGKGFISLIKMIVVPLVFVSIICGISSLGDSKKLGKIGLKTIALFVITTIAGVIISLSLSYIIKPGYGTHIINSQGFVPKSNSKNFFDIILDMVPSNLIKSMCHGNLLQVIIFSSFIGVSIGSLGKKAEILSNFFNVANECILKIVSMIMKVAPIGVFSLISNMVYSTGGESLLKVLKLILTVLLGLILQVFIVYFCFYKLGTRLSFFKFLKNFAKVAEIAFSTASSDASIPFEMQMMKNMGISEPIYRFILPLGATMNMTGTAIMQSACTVFISQLYGLPLSLNSLITIIATAVFASIGTAGVPGAGTIMLAMIVESVGLPVDGIAMIMGIDRILDMMRTPVNVLGDCVCTVLVSKSENCIDKEKYYKN